MDARERLKLECLRMIMITGKDLITKPLGMFPSRDIGKHKKTHRR